MTLLAAISLFGVLAVLAAVPSASVALVATRSAMLGFRNGAAVAMGIVAGDLVFVFLAVAGMSFLAETMGAFFAILKLLGGAYLIWLGLGMFRTKKAARLELERNRNAGLVTSFAAGLLLTLGDVKAILFYASLFPMFLDMNDVGTIDIAGVVIITILAVGGVKLVYAFASQRIISRLQTRPIDAGIKTASGGLMIGAGTWLILKA